MKNNLIIIFIICFFCFPNIVLSQSFTFKTKNIEILNEGNQVNAYEGKAISNDGNLEIKSDKFRYFKNSDVLRTNGNGELLIKSKKDIRDIGISGFSVNNVNTKEHIKYLLIR